MVREHVDVGLAGVAAARRDLAQLERAPEQAAQPVVERRGQLELPVPQHEVLAAAASPSASRPSR